MRLTRGLCQESEDPLIAVSDERALDAWSKEDPAYDAMAVSYRKVAGYEVVERR